ncbi:MAG: ATP:cob(I)alamin adenosyltransferase [Chitinophagales bacterium]
MERYRTGCSPSNANHASDPDASKCTKCPMLEEDITVTEMVMHGSQAGAVKNFGLPGGHTTVSFTHLARTVCRRSERIVTHLQAESAVPAIVLKYLNRLSDYLFVLSRKLARDLDVEEIPWRPRDKQ